MRLLLSASGRYITQKFKIVLQSFKHFCLIKYVMRFIILFELFQYLYYLRSYSTFWLPKKGLFCLMEMSPFLVIFLFGGCATTECRLTCDVMFTKEDIEVE